MWMARMTRRGPASILKAPHGRWNLADHDGLMIDVRNAGTGELTIVCRVENADADPPLLHCNSGQVTLASGERSTLSVPFKRSAFSLAGIPMFGMHGFPPPDSGEDTIDPAAVARVSILVQKPKSKFSFEVGDVRLSSLKVSVERPPEALRSFFPFIDTFGQYIHADWPNKIHTAGDLTTERVSEMDELAAWRGAKSWDKYGGWKNGPLLLGTGFFRTAKFHGKWWLVDPDGRLFFSNGIDCIWPGETTPLDGRAKWFQDFPGYEPDYKEFLSTSDSQWGHYLDTKPACYDFAGANLKRKYGASWITDFEQITQERLRSWGLNTIGNWSDPTLCAQQRTPYVALFISPASRSKVRRVTGDDSATCLILTLAGNCAPAWRTRPARLRTIRGVWGISSTTKSAGAARFRSRWRRLIRNPYQAAKQVLVADLMAKYHAIEKLNAAWGTSYKSWADIIEGRELPE